jgi:hypothetical protein
VEATHTLCTSVSTLASALVILLLSAAALLCVIATLSFPIRTLSLVALFLSTRSSRFSVLVWLKKRSAKWREVEVVCSV